MENHSINSTTQLQNNDQQSGVKEQDPLLLASSNSLNENVHKDGYPVSDSYKENNVPAHDPLDTGTGNLRAGETGIIPGMPSLVPQPASGQGIIPGLSSSSQGATPTLLIGGFSVLKMPMPGMSDIMSGFVQNVGPLLQGLPSPASLPNPFAGWRVLNKYL